MIYKIAVIKFIQKEIRFDFEKCKELLFEVIDKHHMEDIIIFNDYDSKIGFHFNLIFKYNNYMKLIKLYNKKSPEKHKNIFWWMTDLIDYKLLDWLYYCQKRHNDCHKPIIFNPFIIYKDERHKVDLSHNYLSSDHSRISFT